MIKKFVSLIMLLTSSVAMADMASGMLNVESQFPVEETSTRLLNILEQKGMKVFIRIPHSEGAKGVGVELRPMELVVFGNPKIGSPLMKCRQTIAIDLPQKALIWQDGDGKVWISYNDPRYLQKRHGVEGCEEIFSKMEKALAGITQAAASP